jgi:hypothetical protein
LSGTPLVLTEGLRPSDSPTRSLARRGADALRSRGSLARSLATWLVVSEIAPSLSLIAEADRFRDALERSLVGLILVLRRDGDAVEEIAVAEQGGEDRDRFFPAGHF